MLKVRGVLLLAVVASSSQTIAGDTLRENMDFSKSPCVDRGLHVTKGYAVRIFPRISENGELFVDDGESQWKHAFPNLTFQASIDYAIAGTFDAWAVYSTLENNAGVIRSFAVQFAFGDLVSKNAPACLVIPDAPERVGVDDLPPAAVQGYYVGLTDKQPQSVEEMRAALRALLKAG